MKVDQESNLQAEQPQVRKHLGMINRMQRFFALDLYDDSAIHYDVGSESALQLYVLVNSRNCFLLFYSQTHFLQFKYKTRFVCRLQQAGPQSPVDLDSGTNNLFRELVQVCLMTSLRPLQRSDRIHDKNIRVSPRCGR